MTPDDLLRAARALANATAGLLNSSQPENLEVCVVGTCIAHTNIHSDSVDIMYTSQDQSRENSNVLVSDTATIFSECHTFIVHIVWYIQSM